MLVTGQMQKDVEYYRALGPGELITTQMALVQSRPIIERTVKALKLYQRPLDYEKNFATNFKKIFIEKQKKELESELEDMTAEQRQNYFFNMAMSKVNGNIATIPIGTTSMFLITVTDYNPAAATIIANVVSRSFVIFDIEQQIAMLQLTYGEKNETIIRLEKYIEKLEETLDGRILPDLEAMGPASVKIVTQAGMGIMMPMKPGKGAGIAIALIMGIVTGIMLAYGFEYFDHTFRSAQDIERFLKIPFLGSIPERRAKSQVLIKNTNPATKYTQSFQNLSNQIYLSIKNKNLKSLVLSDVEGSKEKVIIAANIGLSLSLSGYSVLIIDADLRNPLLHNIFDVAESPGLGDVIEGKTPFEAAVITAGPNINILTSGGKILNPLSHLSSPAMSDMIEKVKGLYDVVLINCADIKNFTDAVILTSISDGFILVINDGKVKRQIVQYAIAPIEQKNIDIVGAIIANCRYVIPEIIYKLT